LRQGFPEVVMGEGKQAKDIAAIVRVMQRRMSNILITRLDDPKVEQLKRYRLGIKFHPVANAAFWSAKPIRSRGKGTILVVSAGTSDIPVAEEAVVTATIMGNRVERLFDVGVAGIHRLLGNRAKLDGASVLIVVAGMEGALPSVVAVWLPNP
jgi:NCAIR mutase (PurE)-related protein